jgi:hypothetical protein
MDEASGGRARREIERELDANMVNARREYERVTQEFSRTAKESDELPSQDGIVLLQQAGNQLRAAHERYQEALRVFTEFVVHGTIPASTPNRLSDAASG